VGIKKPPEGGLVKRGGLALYGGYNAVTLFLSIGVMAHPVKSASARAVIDLYIAIL